eukprot:m.49337 g.49337  ORF g.49337 m.49337 type:complete len:1181 (+) comp10612_c0_seq1:164-3706(+)
MARFLFRLLLITLVAGVVVVSQESEYETEGYENESEENQQEEQQQEEQQQESTKKSDEEKDEDSGSGSGSDEIENTTATQAVATTATTNTPEDDEELEDSSGSGSMENDTTTTSSVDNNYNTTIAYEENVSTTYTLNVTPYATLGNSTPNPFNTTRPTTTPEVFGPTTTTEVFGPTKTTTTKTTDTTTTITNVATTTEIEITTKKPEVPIGLCPARTLRYSWMSRYSWYTWWLRYGWATPYYVDAMGGTVVKLNNLDRCFSVHDLTKNTVWCNFGGLAVTRAIITSLTPQRELYCPTPYMGYNRFTYLWYKVVPLADGVDPDTVNPPSPQLYDPSAVSWQRALGVWVYFLEPYYWLSFERLQIGEESNVNLPLLPITTAPTNVYWKASEFSLRDGEYLELHVFEVDADGNTSVIGIAASNLPNTGKASIEFEKLLDSKYMKDKPLNTVVVVCRLVHIIPDDASLEMTGIDLSEVQRRYNYMSSAHVAFIAGADTTALTADEVKNNMDSVCNEWHASQSDSSWTVGLPACPPSFNLVWLDWRTWTADWNCWRFCNNPMHAGARWCVKSWGWQRVGRRWQWQTATQQCCYGQQGTLLVGAPSGGTAQQTPTWRWWGTPIVTRVYNDIIPWGVCCSVGGFNEERCNKYYDIRPSDDGSRWRRPRITWAWGDPHFETLDGYQYTFNAHGEYLAFCTLPGDNETKPTAQDTLAACQPNDAKENNSIRITYRLEKVRESDVGTVITSVAMRDPAAPQYPVIVSSVGGAEDSDLNVYIGEDPADQSLLATNGTFEVQDFGFDVTTVENKTTLSVSLLSGMRVTIELVGGALAPVVYFDEDAFSVGLYGAADGNVTNDFMIPNGTVYDTTTLPTTKSARDRFLFDNFGKKWEVSARGNSSLFNKLPADAPVSIINITNDEIVTAETFRPLFGDEPEFFGSPERKALAEAACADVVDANKRELCIFDVIATNNTDIASASIQNDAKQNAITVLLDNTAPILNVSDKQPKGTTLIKLSTRSHRVRGAPGDSINVKYTASDADENATLKFFVSSTPDVSGSTISKWGDMSWKVPKSFLEVNDTIVSEMVVVFVVEVVDEHAAGSAMQLEVRVSDTGDSDSDGSESWVTTGAIVGFVILGVFVVVILIYLMSSSAEKSIKGNAKVMPLPDENDETPTKSPRRWVEPSQPTDV